jgi:acetylornithine deacetylase
MTLGGADVDWLLELLAVPSVSLLEGGDPPALARASCVFVDGARARGFRLLTMISPTAAELEGPAVPEPVRRRRNEPGFLAAHRSAVLAAGGPAPEKRRMVVNFHLDTVAPHVLPRINRGRVHGRGALDDKGPGIAAAVGIASAFAREPWLAEAIEVRLAAVHGEEGGALGVLGTRCLVERGHTGRLMLFAEPTSLALHDAASATATARFEVHGDDATDDRPDAGHNASLALSLLAEQLAAQVVPLAEAVGAKACLAGVYTGESHNRVYGRGALLLNLGYLLPEHGELLVRQVEEVFSAAGAKMRERHGRAAAFRRLAEDWERVVKLIWIKRGVPPLANRDPDMETVCAAAGLDRIDAAQTGRAFTCDAIWAAGPGRYAAICGPGDLAQDGAHTDDEHIGLAQLDAYATKVRDLVIEFGRHASEASACR